jgi:hypothetical protein
MWRHIVGRCEACVHAWGRHCENFCKIKYVEQQKETDSKFPTDAGLLRDKTSWECGSRGHNKTDALCNHIDYKIIHSPSYFAKALPSSGTYNLKVVIKILERNINRFYVLKFGNQFKKNYYVINLFNFLDFSFVCCLGSKSFLWAGQTLNLACQVFLIWYIILGLLQCCVPVLIWC